MRVSKKFYVLDYDRCLGNAERIYDLLQACTVARSDGFDVDSMNKERDEVESQGGSFDELPYVRRHLSGEVQYQGLLHDFVASGRSMEPGVLLEEGALDLLEQLVRRYPCGILTFGSHDWQRVKIEASLPAEIPYIVMGHKYKIKYMKQWRDERTGLFVLPEEFSAASGYTHAEEVILVDDKAAAFLDIEAGMRGYWILHREPLPSQRGEVTELVSEVGSFRQLLKLEAAIDKAQAV